MSRGTIKLVVAVVGTSRKQFDEFVFKQIDEVGMDNVTLTRMNRKCTVIKDLTVGAIWEVDYHFVILDHCEDMETAIQGTCGMPLSGVVYLEGKYCYNIINYINTRVRGVVKGDGNVGAP